MQYVINLFRANKIRVAYGIGDYAICLYWSGVSLYLLYFYTDIVGISPLMAGWIYALGIAWDAISDPFMGFIAERTRTKMGSYRTIDPQPAKPLRLPNGCYESEAGAWEHPWILSRAEAEPVLSCSVYTRGGS